MDRAQLKKLIRRYRKNKASGAERYIVDRWYESLLNNEENPGAEIEAGALETFSKKIVYQTLNKDKPVPLYRRFRTGIAAAIALLLLSAPFILLYKPGGKSAGPATPPYTIIGTNIGEVKRLVLPDSSVIFLNANSKIRIPANFSKQERVVKLQGEAFFEVKSDPKRPFKVHTGALEVRVLGTSFNIRGYTPAKNITVSVSTGKVGVSYQSRIAGMLQKGQKLEFDAATGRSVLAAFRTESGPSWKTGRTVLEKASFDELAEVFYNYYGAILQTNNDQVKATKYNFTIRASRQMEKTLAQLCNTTGTQFRKEEKKIILY